MLSLGLGLGITRGGAPHVPTPVDILGATLLGWLDPRRSDLLSLSGSAVISATDAANGNTLAAPSTPRRPTYTASGTGSKPAIVLSNSANSAVTTTSGGVTGAAAHSEWILARLTTTGITGSIGGLGREGACSILGTVGTAWWGGGTGVSDPRGGTTDTTSLHVLSKIYDPTTLGGIYVLAVDGQTIGAVAATPSLQSGYGLFSYQTGNYVLDAEVYQAVYASGIQGPDYDSGVSHYVQAGPGTTFWRMLQWLKIANPAVVKPVLFGGWGDSQMAGSATSSPTTKSPIARCVAHLSSDYSKNAWLVNKGHAGNTAAQILAAEPADRPFVWTPLALDNIGLYWGGINSIRTLTGGNGAHGADIWADISSTITNMGGAGMTKCIVTTLPKDDTCAGDASRESWRQILNGLIRAADSTTISGVAIKVADLAADSRYDYPSGTYCLGDGVHFTDAGYDNAGSVYASIANAAGWV